MRRAARLFLEIVHINEMNCEGRMHVSLQRMLDNGHEIGVHSHYPGANGTLEHLGVMASWFLALRAHTSWMFAYRNCMTKIFAESDIRVGCRVCYGGKSYRLSERDHYVVGNSICSTSEGHIHHSLCRTRSS